MLAAVAFVTVEYVPAPQSVHATRSVVVLYFPAPHAEHTGIPVQPTEVEV